MLNDNDMIEGLFSLALDPKYNQYLVASNKNIDHMMDYRMMINNLAYDHQELSDRILKACNDNLKVLIADLWQQTRDYLEMFKSNANATPEEREKAERAFNQSQGISSARKCQSVLALLNYYTIEELEIMDSVEYRSYIQNSLKKFDTSSLLLELIKIPIFNA
jgi:hypothetical protein